MWLVRKAEKDEVARLNASDYEWFAILDISTRQITYKTRGELMDLVRELEAALDRTDKDK